MFQPNFIKQQIRQREQEKASKLGHLNDDNPHLSNRGGNTQAGGAGDENVRKKSGRKVIDWTSSCVLYLEVSTVVVC